MIKKIKYIVFGLILLFLFHFESLSVGPLKISHLWKGALLVFLIFSLLRKKTKFVFIYKALFLLSFMQLVNFEVLNNPFNAILLFGMTIILPLLGVYVLKFSAKQLQNSLLFFASFFILSFLPYELGILESYGKRYALLGYGIEEFGLTGAFQTPHAASTALAAAFLVILYFWFTKTYNRIYLSILLILSFYFLIFTYVRTGMAMVAAGALLFVIHYAKKNTYTRIQLIFVGGLFAFLISNWVLSDEVMMSRISGERTAAGTSETDSFEQLGSGRGKLFLTAVDIYTEAHLFEQIFGMGQTEAIKRMYSKIGSSLLPHNGFLQLLLTNGLLGLVLFMSFLYKIYKFQKKLPKESIVFVKALFLSYLTMTFVQSWDMLYMYLILVLGVAYSIGYEKHIKHEIFFTKNT